MIKKNKILKKIPAIVWAMNWIARSTLYTIVFNNNIVTAILIGSNHNKNCNNKKKYMKMFSLKAVDSVDFVLWPHSFLNSKYFGNKRCTVVFFDVL